MAKIDETELKALLSSEISAARLYDTSELSEKRARAMEYYRGDMGTDLPAPPGRSQVVSRDVADTMGWMIPGIIRVFTASDRMAEYEPVGRGDEHFAGQATDYCNHIFFKDNNGYRVLWDATHDSLLQGNGIVKHWWDDAEECEYSEHSGITDEQIALLAADGDVEIVAQKEGEPQRVVDPASGGEIDISTFDVKLKRTTMSGRVRIECIEPENFLMDKHARYIEEARFCAHRDEVSRSDLIEMGFDKALVESLPADIGSTFSEETLAREQEYDGFRNDVGHESTRLIELYECYVRVDVDGDGIAETVRAYYAGASGAGELLDWEVWDDDVPFSDIPCEPVPHRWDARSVADETIDIQRIKTALTRQMLDNLYASNLPMMEVEHDTVVNPEMLVSPKFGGVIWRRKGSMAEAGIKPHAVPFVADKVLNALEYLDQVVEKRTGVSRATMALDPETLQNQTATANQNQKDAAYSQIELIARNQAELGWRRVFRQVLRLIVKHQDRPRTIRLRDDWVDMDPRHWNANMDVTINIGLGTGSRDRDMAMLNNILQTQERMAQGFHATGFGDKAIEMVPKIVKTATKLAESSGIRNPDEYYPQIEDGDVEQMKQQAAQAASQPDPKVQAEIQKAQTQAEIDVQKAQLDAQLRREEMTVEAQIKREQMQMEIQLKREQLAAELQLKRELSMQEMQIKREMGFYDVDTKAAIASSKVSMGGNPG